MAIFDFFLSRNNGPTAQNYIGHEGRLFYDSVDGLFRLSDGHTPGGRIVSNLAIAATGTTPPTNPFQGELWYNPTTKELWAYNNGAFRGTINPATPTTLGGIKAGPGVVVANDGTLSLDSTGIPFNFGDFYAFTNPGPEDGACISSINADQDVNIVSNGTGSVNVVGEFHIHSTNEDLETALEARPKLAVNSDGQVTILVPTPDALAGGVNIVGNATATQQDPVNQGVMLHITGNDGIPARSYLDSVGDYSGFVGRRFNGTAASPTGVLANQEVSRYAANAFTSDLGFESTGIGQLRWYATENITSTNKGGRAEFWAVPTGGATAVKVVTIDSSSLTMASGKTLVGNLTGTATTATSLAAAGSILAGQLTVNPTNIVKGTASVQTFTLTGITTNHKIVALSATQLTYGITITAMWPSALNTISVEFQNISNADVDLGNININYFAWV